MFVYKGSGKEILEKLAKKGFTSYKMRKGAVKKGLNEATMQKIRNDEIVGINALEKICSMLECQANDVIVWKPDAPPAAGPDDQEKNP